MKSYKEHLISTKSFGEKVDLRRQPVYTGSAIFTVMNNKYLETRILFMGYWLVKNKIDELGLLITLRDQKGTILHRESNQIVTASANEISLKKLLVQAKEVGEDFLGSIELEVFSSRDLVFPYPAFVVNYYNMFGSSFVHSTGRVFKNIGDMSNDELHVKECGFDILPGNDLDPFFTFVNGYSRSKKSLLNIEIITGKDVVYEGVIDIGCIEPYEAKIVRFKDFLPVDEYLDGNVGTVKIGHNFTGFFPRFIAGNFIKSVGALSITHTYYDNSDNDSESAYWKNENKELAHDSSVFVPLFIEDNWYTHLKLYPIYSPSKHYIHISFVDKSGVIIKTIKKFKLITTAFSEFIEIDFGSIVERLSLSKQDVKGAILIKEWEDKSKIPSRLKYGLNVGRRGLKFDLPTNICFASQVSNIKLIEKKGAFKWFPILNQGNSIAILENSSFMKNYYSAASIVVTFYRNDEKTIEKNYLIPPNGQIRLEVDGEIKSFSCGDTIWATIKADNPFVKAWYFEFNASGIMGGDHSF
tara:strand:- start:34920 stop:36497 length:1578 start_codon:yes stop_codon:yes gene_type:complete